MPDIGKTYTSYLRNASDLYAFLTVFHHGQIGKAAKSLRISQPSLSQRIRNLEGVVGEPLFIRAARGMLPTNAGTALYTALNDPVHLAAQRFDQFMTRNKTKGVSIAVDYAFAHNALLPKLSEIRQCVGEDIDIRIIASQEPLENVGQKTDITIYMSHADNAPGSAYLLLQEHVSIICNPDFKVQHPDLKTPEDLLRNPSFLLHLRSPKGGAPWCTWEEWFAASGKEIEALRKHTEYNTYELVMRSVLDGGGVALGWKGLMDDVSRRGWIVPFCEGHVVTSRGYFVDLTETKPTKVAMQVYESIIAMIGD